MIYILCVYGDELGYYSTLENAKKARENHIKKTNYDVIMYNIVTVILDEHFL